MDPAAAANLVDEVKLGIAYFKAMAPLDGQLALVELDVGGVEGTDARQIAVLHNPPRIRRRRAHVLLLAKDQGAGGGTGDVV